MSSSDYEGLITVAKKTTRAKGIWESTEQNLRDYFKLDNGDIVIDGWCFTSVEDALKSLDHYEFKRRARNGIGRKTLERILKKYL